MKQLTYATVCSGVECMSVAAMGLPLRPVFFSEIEPFPCAVLKHHFPGVPNLGDMSKIEIKDIDNDTKEITNGRTAITLHGGLDIFAGGTPCQDVSVAGKRRGMQEGSGTRSSLAFEFVRLIRGLRPRYVIWENVAGVLSDESFPKFLAALAECGYRVVYRTFDAQYVTCADITRDDIHGADAGMDCDGGIELSRAVPQRRRRVWVLCSRIERCAGAGVADPAAVLFEPAGVLGDHPPCRKSREEAAAAVGGRAGVHDRVVERTDYDGRHVSSTLTKSNAGGGQRMPDKDNFNAVIERRVSDIKANLAGGTDDTAAITGAHDNSMSDFTNVTVHEAVQTFVKVAHASGKDGEGERWQQDGVVGSRNVFDISATRTQEAVVTTNSNGGDVMPTIGADEFKMTQKQKDAGGGYILHRKQEDADDER